MKIALILPSTPAYSETFFRSKIKGLQAHGHQVVLITAKKGVKFDLCEHREHPKIYKNKVLQLFMMLKVFLSLIFYFKRVMTYYKLEREEHTPFKRILEKIYVNATLLKLNIDWLHFGFATMAINRELVAKSIKAKLAVSLRGFDIAIYPLKHKNCYNLLWKHVNKVHTISNDLITLAKNLGLSKSVHVEKITPAIDVSFFKEKEIDYESQIRFLTVARLHWKKGIVQTLQSLAELKKKQISFTYTIVGDGNDYERIAFAIHEMDLTDQVHLVGKKDREQVRELYERSNIYVQYSISEGFCNAVLEAQAMGLLCVVSDAEGLSENIIHKETGWVVPKNEYKYLTETLLHVIDLSQEIKNKIILTAKKRVRDNFNLEKQQQNFLEFYNQ
ncbi:glycosyltransferase family 4 protein [Cognatitamlana onchidii]|uniref:glycosyltransferase family 4 protein n=1 Tax=Cognatitamlana onchidii TaxID=2562860 RepID=UPI0010A653DE|nr:glycosyltransferase family 4 protein [Algibacter onchidii]